MIVIIALVAIGGGIFVWSPSALDPVVKPMASIFGLERARTQEPPPRVEPTPGARAAIETPTAETPREDSDKEEIFPDAGQLPIPTHGTVIATNVNVRAAPSLRAPIVARVSTGQNLSIVGAVGGWYRIRRGDGTDAYVYGAFVVPQAPGGYAVGICAWPALIHGEPDTRAPVIARAKSDEKFVMLVRRAGWVEVLLPDGRRGWVQNGLIRRIY